MPSHQEKVVPGYWKTVVFSYQEKIEPIYWEKIVPRDQEKVVPNPTTGKQ